MGERETDEQVYYEKSMLGVSRGWSEFWWLSHTLSLTAIEFLRDGLKEYWKDGGGEGPAELEDTGSLWNLWAVVLGEVREKLKEQGSREP